MAAIAPFPRAALVKVEVDFTSNWNTASPSYTDVTGDLRFSSGVVWERGRNDEFQSLSPGSCQFTLNNRARTYDPTTNANMVPGRPARVTCFYPTTSTAYQQIALSVEDWQPNWSRGKDAVVSANCIERFGSLAFSNITSGGSFTQTEAQRLTAIATAAGWPPGLLSFTAGGATLPAGAVGGATTLDAMQATAAAYGDIIYEDRNGVIRAAGLFSGTGSSGVTFGDQAGELPFVVPDGAVGEGYWYTVVELTVGGAQWTQGFPNKVTKAVGTNYPTSKYGIRTYALTLAATDQTHAQGACNGIATALNNLSPYRLKQIQIRPMVDPANLFPVVLAADYGLIYTVNFQPPGGGSRISFTAKLRSIRHEITESDWLVTWMLSP